MHQHLAAMRLLNEVIQHAFGDLEVRDYAVLHGPDGHDVAGRAAQHVFGFLADRLHFAIGFVDGYDGRLIHYDALAFGKHQRIGGPKVDREIGGEQTKERANVHFEASRGCITPTFR